MKRKILAVFAHPDDEAFGPGGTLAKYGHEGVEIHLLCATRGEAGAKDKVISNQLLVTGKKKKENIKLNRIREREVIESAEVLGIKKVEFMDFVDGTLCNNLYHKLADKIAGKISEFKPQIVLTNERLGISGHLDHIAVLLTTTYAFLKTRISNKLYYNCMFKGARDTRLDNYFIYFPEGYGKKDITTRIDHQKYYHIKVKAMKMHISQSNDVKALLERFDKSPKIDHFILQHYQGIKPKFPETDFFEGL